MIIRYWDSTCFIAWFSKEEDRVDDCQSVIQAALDGKVQIVTSALTLAEVVQRPTDHPLPSGLEETINGFFENEFVIVRNVDRYIGAFARHLLWSYQHLKYKDAIHVATAIQTPDLHCLDSFDDDMLKLNDKLGSPVLRICTPRMPMQIAIEGTASDG